MITGGSDPRSPVAVTARVWVRGSLAGGSDPVHGGRWVPDRERCRPFRVGPRDDGRWSARPASVERVPGSCLVGGHRCGDASVLRGAMSARSCRSEGLLLRGSLTTFRRRCGKPTCRCAAGEPPPEPGVGVHRGWLDQDPHLADADVPEVVAAFGPFRGCPSRAGACSRRLAWQRCAPAGACERPSGEVRRTGAVLGGVSWLTRSWRAA